MIHRVFAVAAALLLSSFTVLAGGQSPSLPRSYIVQLRDAPAASYAGGVNGLARTKPPAGQRLDVNAANVQAYINYVGQKQRNVVSTVGNVRVLHRYDTVFNGFSAVLTEDQARQLKARGDVASVRLDEQRHVNTSYTPVFLGLDKPGGLWPQLGGKGAAGEDIVVGIIDTGVTPDSPSFTDRIDGTGRPDANGGAMAYGPPPARWKGACETGPGFSSANCNNKLIGARAFRSVIDVFVELGIVEFDPSEFASPRDSNGHGTHTASTAAGNNGVAASFNGGVLGMISGMAPRARVATYKVCWTYRVPGDSAPGQNSCFSSDAVAAIEQAVKDGVQVINYSISGSQNQVDPTDLAFLGATNAGVFVAAAGGNEGPENNVNHVMPWVTTVAATTHDRTYEGAAQLGNGTVYSGATLNMSPLAARPMINGSQAGTPDAPPDSARLCANDGSLDPKKVAGRVVVCDRGIVALVDKSAAVKAAGGVGMVLLNVEGGATDTYSLAHSVPTVHLTLDKSAAVKAYAAQPNATVALSAGTAAYGKVPAPVVANFSSRGPNLYDANVLKPDLGAPGVSILASVAPVLTPAQHDAVANGAAAPPAWDIYQGTSMASPHVAGVAALLIQKHPDWSPSAVKSALMTTAFSTLPDTLEDPLQRGTTPWGQGAGQIDPTRAADPGLVYQVPSGDYERYLCSTGYALSDCANRAPLNPTDLNLASMTVAAVTGQVSFTRSVTNVGSGPATYSATGVLPGFEVRVSPSVLALAAGETKSFTVSLTKVASSEGYSYGSLTWSDGTHRVHSPLTVYAKPMVVPVSLYSEAASGSKVFTVGTGFSGKFTMAPMLKAPKVTPGIIQKAYGGGLCDPSENDASYYVKARVEVPPGALAVRGAIYDEDYPAGLDVGLLLNSSSAGLFASFTDGTNDEALVIVNPPPGTYDFCVLTLALPAGGLPVKLHTWLLMPGDAAAGGLKAMGSGLSHVAGTSTVGLSWHGLVPGNRYYGVLSYLLDGQPVDFTQLQINTANPLQPSPATVPRKAGKSAMTHGGSVGAISDAGRSAVR